MGLKRAKSFDDITSDSELAQKLSDLYKGDIDNVDLYIAGWLKTMNLTLQLVNYLKKL